MITQADSHTEWLRMSLVTHPHEGAVRLASDQTTSALAFSRPTGQGRANVNALIYGGPSRV